MSGSQQSDSPELHGGPPGRRARITSSLRYRDFRLVWYGQIGRGLAWWAQAVTLPLWVLRQGGGPVDLGLVTLLQFGPVVILAPLGGALADDLPRRRVLPILQVILAAVSLSFMILVLTDSPSLGWVFALALVFGVVNAIEMPMRQSFIADIVPLSELSNAIALNQVAFNTTRIVGPGIAGLLIASMGMAAAFGLAVASSLVVATLMLRLESTGPSRAPFWGKVSAMGPALGSGVRHTLTEPFVLWPMLLLASIGVTSGGFMTILPLYAVDVLSLDDEAYGAILGVMGVGALFGAVPNTTADVRVARDRMSLAAIGLGAVLVAIAFVSVVLPAALLVAAVGFLTVVMNGSVNQTIQATVSPQLRGRVMGQHTAVFHGGPAVGGFLSGVAMAAWGVPAAIAVTGVFTAVIAIAIRLRLKRLVSEAEGALQSFREP